MTTSRRPEMHEVRTIAESFGTDAARYDRARFPYPSELIDRIIVRAPGSKFPDVGCGAGIAARQFAAGGHRGSSANARR